MNIIISHKKIIMAVLSAIVLGITITTTSIMTNNVYAAVSDGWSDELSAAEQAYNSAKSSYDYIEKENRMIFGTDRTEWPQSARDKSLDSYKELEMQASNYNKIIDNIRKSSSYKPNDKYWENILKKKRYKVYWMSGDSTITETYDTIDISSTIDPPKKKGFEFLEWEQENDTMHDAIYMTAKWKRLNDLTPIYEVLENLPYGLEKYRLKERSEDSLEESLKLLIDDASKLYNSFYPQKTVLTGNYGEKGYYFGMWFKELYEILINDNYLSSKNIVSYAQKIIDRINGLNHAGPNPININQSTIYIKEGSSYDLSFYLSAAYEYTRNVEDDITWSSEDTDVATVMETGDGFTATVYGKNQGETYITIRLHDVYDLYFEGKIYVRVQAEVRNINLSDNMIVMEKGESKKITSSVYPEEAVDKKLVWSSSNTDVATVSDKIYDNNGYVTAVDYGTATITAKSSNGKTATCTIIVKEKDTRTGVYYENGQWIYLENGEHLTNYTGYGKSSKGKWVFVRNGVFDPSYTGLAKNKTNGGWFYAENGVYKKGYTGVAKSTDDKMYFVKNSKWDKTYTGFAKYTDGKWYFVRNGVHDPSYTGLAKNKTNGGWFYAENGVYKAGYTGIAKSTDDKLYYVKGSKWDKTYTGFGKYTDGKWYFVKKGAHDPSYTGLAKNKSNGGWFYAENGVYKPGYTGIAKSTDDNLYYVKDSKWDNTFTGKAMDASGNEVSVKNGRVM